MNVTSSAAGLIAALLLLAAGPAGASPGNGIRLGGSEGRLHPYLDLEGRWDSNVYYGTKSLADVIVHVRPGFSLKVPGELAAVELDANVDRAQYLGVQDPSTKDLSRLYAAASLGLTVNRRGTLGLELDDQFRRDPTTSTFVFAGAVVSNKNLLSVRVPWRPGGGALVIAPTFAWGLETFEPLATCTPGFPETSCDPTLLGKFGYNNLRAGADARWRFLPRTSAFFEGGWFSRVPNDKTVAMSVSGVEGRVGLSGLVTPHLGATVKVGYARALQSTPDTFGSVVATIEGEWLASDSARVRLGWDHGFGTEPAQTLFLYTSDRVLLGARYSLAGRYGATLDASWDRRAYAFASGSPNATLLRVEPGVEAAIARWINLSLSYAYTTRDSSFDATPGYNYSKNEAWLRLVFTY